MVAAGRGAPLDVLDPETMQRVPHDGETLGEVMFRGNTVMKGYLKNPKSTDAAFAGGWFHSGDLGVMHPDGYIQLKDRSKDIIISGGENISSIEVEDALYKHPAVQAAAVVAKPDEKWGETPCAFVELKPGQDATIDELVAWCKQNLAGYKVPRSLWLVDEVKRSPAGKPDYRWAKDVTEAIAQATDWARRTQTAVIVKTGHLDGASAANIWVAADGHTITVPSTRIDTTNTHGTGCSLSSAITAGLALGQTVPEAVGAAHEWLQGAIAAADGLRVGSGHGPVHHFHRWWQP